MRSLVFGCFLIVTALAATSATEAHAQVEQRLLGIHHLSLKDGVAPETFEQFVTGEWNPVMRSLWPGIQLMVVKGERNAKAGQFLLVYDIESMSVRDRYWPSTSEETAASEAVLEKCGQTCTELQERFAAMVEIVQWADWVELRK